MAVDINNELKKATQKTNVYKTYKEYKQGYDKLKKKAGDSQEPANKAISQPLDKFVNWRKKHTTRNEADRTQIQQLDRNILLAVRRI